MDSQTAYFSPRAYVFVRGKRSSSDQARIVPLQSDVARRRPDVSTI